MATRRNLESEIGAGFLIGFFKSLDGIKKGKVNRMR